jgi:hypothetical protein
LSRRRVFAVVGLVAVGVTTALSVGHGHDAQATAWVAAKDGPRPEIHHDTSPPLRTIAPKREDKGRRVRAEHRFPHSASTTTADPVVQLAAPTKAAPTTGVGFQGMTATDGSQSGMPPDPNAAVGPSNVVEVVNTTFAVYSKTGVQQYPDPAVAHGADTNTLWTGFDPSGPGHACETENDGDATVAYDRAAGRFVIQQFSLEPFFFGTGAYLECVAVSATGDPTGAWHRYAFDGFGDEFPDYPKLGVWPDGYYTTYNLFAGGISFDGTEVCAYERAQMLVGNTAQQQCNTVSDQNLNGLLPSSVESSTPPPAGSPNYLLGISVPTSGSPTIRMFKFHVDWANPANSTFSGGASGVAVAGVPSFTLGCGGSNCIKQPSPGAKLDSLGDRLMYPLGYRNFGGGHEALVVSHTVTAGTVTGVRWYEIRNPNAAAPTVFQSGTFAPSDGNFRWMGSAAQDKDGDIALGYSLSGTSMKTSVAITGRLAEDPAGSMTQTEKVVKQSGGVQISDLNCGPDDCALRWGDYSSMQIDPSDDCTFWYTNQFIPLNGNFNWKTWIQAFTLPNCGSGGGGADDFSISASPTSVTVQRGFTGKSIINTAVTSGSPQTVTFNATGQPSGVTVKFKPPSVLVGTVSKMKMVVSSSAKKGTYTLTVNGVGTSATHSTTVSLKVT